MKNIIILLGVIFSLTACNTNEQNNPEEQNDKIEFIDKETKNIELAKADLTRSDFDTAIKDSELYLEGATYEAYLLLRASLSRDSYEKAQEQKVFSTQMAYDDYKKLSTEFQTRDDFENNMFSAGDEVEEFAYALYAAKSVQYITPLSPVEFN